MKAKQPVNKNRVRSEINTTMRCFRQHVARLNSILLSSAGSEEERAEIQQTKRAVKLALACCDATVLAVLAAGTSDVSDDPLERALILHAYTKEMESIEDFMQKDLAVSEVLHAVP